MAWFGYKGFHAHAIKREKMTRVQKAKDFFVVSVTTSLKGLYPIPSNWPEDSGSINYVLESVFDDIQIAVSNFREVVPKDDRTNFDKAWFIYRVGENGEERDKQCYHQYMGFTIDDHYIDPQKKLKENVDRLLSFAKQT